MRTKHRLSRYEKIKIRRANLPPSARYKSQNEYKKRNPELARKRVKEWKAKHPNYDKEYHIKNKHKWQEIKRINNRKRLYGISDEEYKEILVSQHSNCAICFINQSQMTRQLAVDHNHKTNKVRGLLCATCNLALGYLKENKNIVKSMIKYIEKYEE